MRQLTQKGISVRISLCVEQLRHRGYTAWRQRRRIDERAAWMFWWERDAHVGEGMGCPWDQGCGAPLCTVPLIETWT